MKKVIIEIDDKAYKVLEKQVVKKKKFSTIEDYLQDIVEQVVRKIEVQTIKSTDTEEEKLTDQQRKIVKKRLRDLGYIE